MHGNVWEWCWGWRGEYPSSPDKNPVGPSTGVRRVIRGGSWLNGPEDCGSAYRYWRLPESRDDLLGFRVARSPSASKQELARTEPGAEADEFAAERSRTPRAGADGGAIDSFFLNEEVKSGHLRPLRKPH